MQVLLWMMLGLCWLGQSLVRNLPRHPGAEATRVSDPRCYPSAHQSGFVKEQMKDSGSVMAR